MVPALLLLIVAACGGADDAEVVLPTQAMPAPDTQPSIAAPATTPATAPATPATTSAVDYQAALTALDKQLAQAVDELAGHRSPVGLTDALVELRGQVDAERAALSSMVPPTTVADAHTELDVALSDLSFELSALEAEAASHVVCAGDAALRRLSNTDGAAAIREAAARLTESDPREEFTVGTFVPETLKERNRRGRNGDLRPGRRGGLGELRVTGSPDLDSVLKLRMKDRGIRNVYVRKNSTVTVESLPDGRYQIFLAQGKDWNKGTNRFTRQCTFSKFDDRLNFSTTSTQYTIYELQLLKSVFGNATSTVLDPEDFPN